MTIGIDSRFAAFPVGLGTYTRELARALAVNNPDVSFVFFVHGISEEWIPKSSNIRAVRAPFRHYSIAEHLNFPKLIKASKIDIFFAPQFNVPFFCPVPFVATIHDLILHHYPNQSGPVKRMMYKILMKRTIQHAKKILTVSDATKYDLLEVYGHSLNDKIHTAYPGVSERFTPQSAEEIGSIRTKYNLPDRYILYVGNAKEHKNVQLLLDSFSDLNDETLHLALLMFGKEADRLQLGKRVIRLKNLPDNVLPALYSASVGFASATLYEGFGLPFLEAMACGTPVLGTNIPSLREVCAGHALLVSPNRQAFANGLKTLLQPDAEQIHGAITYASAYTWKKTADSVATMLKQ